MAWVLHSIGGRYVTEIGGVRALLLLCSAATLQAWGKVGQVERSMCHAGRSAGQVVRDERCSTAGAEQHEGRAQDAETPGAVMGQQHTCFATCLSSNSTHPSVKFFPVFLPSRFRFLRRAGSARAHTYSRVCK